MRAAVTVTQSAPLAVRPVASLSDAWRSFLAGLAVVIALATPPAGAINAPPQGQEENKAESVDASADGAKEKAEFKPPPGFLTKKRGELILYCKKDSTVGTRFKTEKCYDEAQLRDYMVAQEENKRDIDRVRNTCVTGQGEYCVRQ